MGRMLWKPWYYLRTSVLSILWEKFTHFCHRTFLMGSKRQMGNMMALICTLFCFPFVARGERRDHIIDIACDIKPDWGVTYWVSLGLSINEVDILSPGVMTGGSYLSNSRPLAMLLCSNSTLSLHTDCLSSVAAFYLISSWQSWGFILSIFLKLE